MPSATSCTPSPRPASVWEILRIFLRLGLTSFGGPTAHVGFFRTEFVERRGWLSDAAYADLMALCQFLPGPMSSQVGIGLGASQAGVAGALAAWLGFTLPSALLMLLFASGVAAWAGALDGGWLHGLKVAATAVVAQAVWTMARSLCPDRVRASVALAAAGLVLSWPFTPGLGQIAVILAGAAFGWGFLQPPTDRAPHTPLPMPISRGTAVVSLGLFLLLLAGLPLLAQLLDNQWLALAEGFFRSGTLVFGGGHVVLPLLEAATVTTGWVDRELFLAGYGAAQALPGPLVSFAAYLGAVIPTAVHPWLTGIFCLAMLYLPSFTLVLGALPFWEALRRAAGVQAALQGINAAVVGVLLAALYQPVWTSAILGPREFSLGLAAFGLLHFWKAPPWGVVLLCGVVGGVVLGR